jgi:hypothetical protein
LGGTPQASSTQFTRVLKVLADLSALLVTLLGVAWMAVYRATGVCVRSSRCVVWTPHTTHTLIAARACIAVVASSPRTLAHSHTELFSLGRCLHYTLGSSLACVCDDAHPSHRLSLAHLPSTPHTRTLTHGPLSSRALLACALWAMRLLCVCDAQPSHRLSLAHLPSTPLTLLLLADRRVCVLFCLRCASLRVGSSQRHGVQRVWRLRWEVCQRGWPRALWCPQLHVPRCMP